MTGRWNKHKTKKTLETSLGQAPKEAEKVADLSHLRKPITTSIFGLKQVLSLFQTATAEVREYITFECDVLYECRICRTIFRSLANFILHKRDYCRDKYNNLRGIGPENSGGFVVADGKEERVEDCKVEKKNEDCEKVSSPELSPSEAKKGDGKKTILPIIDKLVKKQEVNILARNTLNQDLSTKAENEDDDVVFVSEESNVMLQKIDTSKVAVFQTTVKDPSEATNSHNSLMKSEVMEIHGILDHNEAVLGSNGKVCTFETNKKFLKPNIPKQDLVCIECNFTFSTEKTLTHHIKYKHNRTCIVYPCPDCRETFANAWSVYRHLYKVHRRTSSQVRRMRAQIHSSGIRKDQEPERKKDKPGVRPENEQNQWMNDLEKDKDLQMCGGCGKRFERKAALHSHSQMCTKRIAVCNTIRENSLKVKAAERKTEKVKVKVLKGSAKRKPNLLYLHRIPNLEMAEQMKQKEDEEKKDEKVSEVISDSDEEKENSVTKREVGGDVVITKYKDSGEGETNRQEVAVPEIEIFTISDDSYDSEKSDSSAKRKRKRAASWDLEDKGNELAVQEYKEYLNDELDQCFFIKAVAQMDRNSLKCVPCDETFMSQYQLLQHMSLHFSWFRFQCSKCSFTSFYKYDCTTHAYSSHGTPTNLIGSTVLPIPKWKVLCGAHNFAELNDSTSNNNSIESKSGPEQQQQPESEGLEEISNKTMPVLEIIPEAIAKCEKTVMTESVNGDDSNHQGSDVSESGQTSSETIVLEDDEMPDICSENAQSGETVVLSDEELKDQVLKDKVKAGPSKVNESVANNRPVRNRTKSVKTVQNDFIYDLAKVLKLNDNSIKSGRVKKSIGKTS